MPPLRHTSACQWAAPNTPQLRIRTSRSVRVQCTGPVPVRVPARQSTMYGRATNNGHAPSSAAHAGYIVPGATAHHPHTAAPLAGPARRTGPPAVPLIIFNSTGTTTGHRFTGNGASRPCCWRRLQMDGYRECDR